MPEVGEHQKDAKNRDRWWTICKECGEGFWSLGYDTCVPCFSKSFKPGNKQVMGGVVYIKLDTNDSYYPMTVKTLGYWGEGWVNEARYVMAQHLGRCLEKNEFVYHRNSNKMDNQLQNLTLEMPPVNHAKYVRAVVAKRNHSRGR